MNKLKSRYRSWIRCAAVIVICAFLVNDCAFAAGSLNKNDGRDTLSPVSEFNPIVRIEEKDGKFVIIEDPAETAQMVEEFQEDTGFVYLSLLIGQVIRRYGDRISAEALKALIRKHLSHINFTRFKWEELRKEGDTFCLPYERKDDGRIQILRFYAPDTDIVQYPRSTEDETNPLSDPDIVRIPLGDGLSVILEDPFEDDAEGAGEAAEYSYEDLVAEGYVVKIHPPEMDEALNVPRINVDILSEGGERNNYARISYLVIEGYGVDSRGTIVIENLYPEFPEERKGRGRALLRHLLSRSEYAGYQVVSYASEQFQNSFLEMTEYEPMTNSEGETVFSRVGQAMIDYLYTEEGMRPFVRRVALYEKLQEIWFNATLYGRVPRQDGDDFASTVDDMGWGDEGDVDPGFPEATGTGRDRELDLGMYEGIPGEEAAALLREDLDILMEGENRIALRGMELVASEERTVDLWITEITDMLTGLIYRGALAAAVTDIQLEMLEHTDLDILKAAIKESVKNAVIWGNRMQSGRLVAVKWHMAPTGLVIDVADEGEPFDIHAERELPEGVNRLLAGGSRGLAEHIAPFLSADSVRVTESHRYVYGKPLTDIRNGDVVGKTLTLEFPAQLGRDLILSVAAGEGAGTLPAPHVNAVPKEIFDFERELFHVETERLWREPNLVKLWRDAARDVLAEDIGADIADQLIVYPRGGVLHGKWEEGDLDLTFYLNDWVYEHYGEDGLPYCRMVNRFMELAGTAGLSVVEKPYNTARNVQSSPLNDKFNQFPVHILNTRGNAIEIDIHDGPLSFLDAGMVKQGGAVGFVYDPEGNYYGRRDVLDMLDKYVGATRVDDLVSAKLEDIAQTVENLESYIQNIRTAYRSISRTAFADYLFKYYRKPFVRAVTLWRLLGRENMVEETIRTLEKIEASVRSGTYTDPYQFLEILDPLYDDMLRTFKEHVSAARMTDLRADVNLRVYAGLGRHPHKKMLKALLDDIGVNYPETWYQDISALPVVTNEYGGDLEAFVADAAKGLEAGTPGVTPAYEELMAYLAPSLSTTLQRHAWIIYDLRERIAQIVERKLASPDPDDKTLTLWELGSGHLEPVLMAAIVLTEFDRHPAWGAPGDKIKIAIKCVDIDAKVSDRIADVLENGFPTGVNGNGEGNSMTRYLDGEVEEYRVFVNTPANRRRIKDLGIIEPIRASAADTSRVLSPLMDTADIVYLSYVLWELGDRARYKVLEAVSDLKKGAVAYLRVRGSKVDEIDSMVGEKAEMKWKDDIAHDLRTHFALEGRREVMPDVSPGRDMFTDAVKGKNVLFVSFRLNAEALDGVSLETDKWAEIMAEGGATVHYYSGETADADFLKGGVTFPLAQAQFMNKRIGRLNKRIFKKGKITPKDDAELNEIKEDIKRDLRAYIWENNIEYLVAENILAYPGNISLSEAFIEVADELGLKVIAHSHDFWFERDEFLRKAGPELRERLNNIIRGAKKMSTVVINESQKARLEGEGLAQDVLIAPNVMDFAHPSAVPAPDDILRVREACEVEEGDIFLLAPVRPVPRKELHDALNVCEQLHNKTGRAVKLVIPHPCAGRPYFRELVRYARKIKGVRLLDVSGKIEQGDFTLEDTYHACDMAVYMSSLEGWGNGLVEAMYYRKPVIVNTYPVYLSDIKPKGVRVVETMAFYSASPVLETVMRFLERLPFVGMRVRRFRQVSLADIIETVRLLGDPGLVADTVDHNYRVSEKEFSYETLRGILTDAIEKAEKSPAIEEPEESGEPDETAMHALGGPFYAAVQSSDDDFTGLSRRQKIITYAAGSIANILVPLVGYALLTAMLWADVIGAQIFTRAMYYYTMFAASSIINGIGQLVPFTVDFDRRQKKTPAGTVKNLILWGLMIATFPIVFPMTIIHELGHLIALKAFGGKSAHIVMGRAETNATGKIGSDGKKVLDLIRGKEIEKRVFLPEEIGGRNIHIYRQDSLDGMVAYLRGDSHVTEAENLRAAYTAARKKARAETGVERAYDVVLVADAYYSAAYAYDVATGYGAVIVSINILRGRQFMELELEEEFLHLDGYVSAGREGVPAEEAAIQELTTDMMKAKSFYAMSVEDQAALINFLVGHPRVDAHRHWEIYLRAYPDEEQYQKLQKLCVEKHHIWKGSLESIRARKGDIRELVYEYATREGIYGEEIRGLLLRVGLDAWKERAAGLMEGMRSVTRYPEGRPAWPIRDNALDMIVSRAAVNFAAHDEADTLYSAEAYAYGYPSHGVKDYNEKLGLKGRKGIVSHIRRRQKARSGERFMFLDLGTGSAGIIRELAESEDVDQSRLTLIGANSPEEEAVWAEYSADLTTRPGGVQMIFFDHFAGWDYGEKGGDAVAGTEERFRMKMDLFLREILRVLKPGGEAHIDVGDITKHAGVVDSAAAELRDKGSVFYEGGTLHITKAIEKWTGPWAAIKRGIIRALLAVNERLLRRQEGRLRRLEASTRKVAYSKGDVRGTRRMPYREVNPPEYEQKWAAIRYSMVGIRSRIGSLEKSLERLTPPGRAAGAVTYSAEALDLPGPREQVPDMEAGRTEPADAETPPGSIRSVFKYLCDNNVTTIEGALTGEEIAAEMGRSYETIKYDLRALYYHLHLAERDTSEGTGPDARYFVPESIRNKAGRFFPVLSQFRGKDLRPGVPLLEQTYRTEIEPRLNLPGTFPAPSYLDNPYKIEQNINRSFSRLDDAYGNDISVKVEERIRISGKARVLVIGVGRGFEAFELMHKYGNKVEITAIAKENLLYPHPGDLKKRFEGSGIHISREKARQYIRRLRRSHVEWDVEMGLPFERGDQDIAVFGVGVTEYIRRKYPVVEEAVRVVCPGGAVYVDLDAFIVVDEGVEYSAENYFRKANAADITFFNAQRFRIDKGKTPTLPGLEEIAASQDGREGPEWETYTYYRPVTRPQPELPGEAAETLGAIVTRLRDENPYRRAAAAQDAASEIEGGEFRGQPGLMRRLSRALSAVTQDEEVVAVQAVRALGLAGRHIAFDRDVERQFLWHMGTVSDESPLFMELVSVFRIIRGGSLEFEKEGTAVLIRRLETTSDMQVQGVIISVLGELDFLIKRRHERTLENVFYVLRRIAADGRYDASLVPGLFRNGVARGAEVIEDIVIFGRRARREAVTQMVKLFIRKAENTLERIWTSDFHRTPIRYPTEKFFELYDTFLGMVDPRSRDQHVPDPIVRIAAANGIFDILAAHTKYLHRVEQLERVYLPDGVSEASDETRQVQNIATEDIISVLRAMAAQVNHANEKTALLRVLLEWMQPGLARAGIILPLLFDPNNTVCVLAAQVIVSGGDVDAIEVVLRFARERKWGVGKALDEANDERTKGAIENVFAYLCKNGITGSRSALSGEEIAEKLGLSYETIKYDLRALSRHLLLLERDTSGGVGRHARYFVTPAARGREERFLPILEQFKGKDLRPTVDRLKGVYDMEIAGILRETVQPVRAASELERGDWVKIKRVNAKTGRIIYEKEMRVTSVSETDNEAVLRAERFGYSPKEEAHTYFNRGDVTTVIDEITLLPEPENPFTVPFDDPKARMGEKEEPAAAEEPVEEEKENKPAEKELSAFEAKEKVIAERFMDVLLVQVEARAIAAKELGQKIIIGIDTGWIPEEQRISVMNGLLNRLSRLSKQKGLDNIIIRRRKDGSRLPALIRKDMEDTGTPLGNVVILGQEELLGGKAFKSLRGTEGREGAFFAGVRMPKEFKEDSYVRLLEMLTIAVNLAFGESVSHEDHPDVVFEEVHNRFYVLIPDATAYDYETLAKLYRIQKTVIDTGA